MGKKMARASFPVTGSFHQSLKETLPGKEKNHSVRTEIGKYVPASTPENLGWKSLPCVAAMYSSLRSQATVQMRTRLARLNSGAADKKLSCLFFMI